MGNNTSSHVGNSGAIIKTMRPHPVFSSLTTSDQFELNVQESMGPRGSGAEWNKLETISIGENGPSHAGTIMLNHNQNESGAREALVSSYESRVNHAQHYDHRLNRINQALHTDLHDGENTSQQLESILPQYESNEETVLYATPMFGVASKSKIGASQLRAEPSTKDVAKYAQILPRKKNLQRKPSIAQVVARKLQPDHSEACVAPESMKLDLSMQFNGKKVAHKLPMPRSKSFHQILRRTPNGQMLASNGTIRGVTHDKSDHPLDSRLELSRLQHNRSEERKTTHRMDCAQHLPSPPSFEFGAKKLDPRQENEAMKRISQSESNLCGTTICDYMDKSKDGQSPEAEDDDGCESSEDGLRGCESGHSCDESDTSDFEYCSYKLGGRRHVVSEHTQANLYETSQHRPTRLEMNNVNNCGTSSGVAARIHKIRMLKQRKEEEEEEERNDVFMRLRCRNELAHSFKQFNLHLNPKHRIKRSVSNIDACVCSNWSVLDPSGVTLLPLTKHDCPWRLQRPQAKSRIPIANQYLSFEFLNQRITSRLQEEFPPSKCSPIHDDGHSTTSSSGGSGKSKPDSAYHSDNLAGVPKRTPDGSRLASSVSEGSLVSAAIESNTTNIKAVLNKRKSFKQMIENYFSSNEESNGKLKSFKTKVVSTDTMLSENGFGWLDNFDDNFILKRKTPNAGLANLEHANRQHDNLREYITNGTLFVKTSRRKLRSNSILWGKSARTKKCKQTTPNAFTTKHQEMLDNIFSELNENSELDSNDSSDGDRINKLRMSFKGNHNSTSSRSTGNLSSDLDEECQSPRLVVSDNNIGKLGGQQVWTPLQDLGSEDSELDEIDFAARRQTDRCKKLLNDIVDVDVEDLSQFSYIECLPPSSCVLPKTSSVQHLYSEDALHSAAPRLPPEPCFTLSNQLRTLIHNSSRFKNHQMFFF